NTGGNGYACTDMPEIQWSPVNVGGQFPAFYQVTIADDPDFTNVERIYSTPFLTLTPRDQLPDYTAGGGYWVAVEPCGVGTTATNGCAHSTLAHFTKQTPKVGNLSASSLSGGELFTWNDLMNSYASALGTPGNAAVEA